MPSRLLIDEPNRFAGTGAAAFSETPDDGSVSLAPAAERTSRPLPGLREFPPVVAPAKSSKRSVAARALDVSGCGGLLRRLRTWRGVLILNYHRIGNPERSDLDRNLWSATPEDFDAQMASLKAGFDVIGLNDLADALADPHGRFTMITFDDGYRDNYSLAYRILRDHGLPATFFITTGYLDRQIVPWWDEIAWIVSNSTVDLLPAGDWFDNAIPIDRHRRDRAIGSLLRHYKRLGGDRTDRYLDYLGNALQTGRCPAEVGRELWMTWDMIREMRADGMSFGGHTVNHPVLANLPAGEQDYEIGECRRRLVAELGEPIDAFSYPVGGKSAFNQLTQRTVERHGYRWGFTFQGGYHPPCQFDRYALRRTAIESDIDVPMFRAITTLPQVFA